MAIKTTGAEFKRFYADTKYWPTDINIWHEDEVVTVDGREKGPSDDLADIPDSADVRIEGGIVFGPQWKENEPSFETYFKRWRKEQTTKSFLVECDEDKLEAVMAAIKAAGAKVAK
jgi:hypothetical protein